MADTVTENKVVLGVFARAALAAALEQHANALLMSSVEVWYNAKGQPVPPGRWRLVIDSASLQPVTEDAALSQGATNGRAP